MSKSPLCPICSQPKKHSEKKSPSLWSKTCGQRSCIKQLTQQKNYENYGHISNLHAKIANGNTVLQEIMMTKYNVKNPSQLEDVKIKKQKTCQENFGVRWPMQSEIVKAKSVETLISKYGYDNISKVPEIIEKIKQTHIARYGVLFMQTAEGKDLLKAICREKYGVDWYFSSDDFKVKLEKRCLELFGVTNPFYSHDVQSSIAKRNGRGKSQEETEWLDKIGVHPDYRQHKITSISGKTYIVDGYDPSTNTVYEWNGSFWHGNPDYYDLNENHPIVKNLTYGEIYKKTIDRQQDILDSGFNLIVEWSKQ
jgi:hypothetical protein